MYIHVENAYGWPVWSQEGARKWQTNDLFTVDVGNFDHGLQLGLGDGHLNFAHHLAQLVNRYFAVAVFVELFERGSDLLQLIFWYSGLMGRLVTSWFEIWNTAG